MKQDNIITIERVRILYSRAFASISTALVAAFIVASVIREQTSLPVLLSWLGFMLVISLFRYWLLFDYKRNKETTSSHDKFESLFIYSTGLVGAGWAFIIMLGLSLSEFEYRVYSLLLLVAIVAIAAPIFSSSIKTVYAYIAPPLITTVPFLIAQGGDNVAIGLALMVFAVVVIRSSNNIYNTLIDTFSSRFQAQQLAEDMKQLRSDKSATENLMQDLMDNAPAAIYVNDIDGRFTFINQRIADVQKVKREQLIGKTLYDFLPKDIADSIHAHDLEVINSKSPMEYEESIPQDDGFHQYLSIKFPLFNEAGEVYATGGVSTDITERFRIEESLNISQQRLLLHREQSPVGVIEWNADFEFLDWNPAAERIFGYTKEEVLGQHITTRILPESARQAVDKVWSELLAQKGGTYSLNENITKDGRTILCEWHNTPLVDHDGNVIGVTSLVGDVTVREKNEEALRQSQKMDAIGKLTGGIAHDFNNMLGVILGFSELLKEQLTNNDSKQIKYCNEILNAGERARKLTSKLQDFSRKTPSYTETIDLNKLLEGMQHLLEKTLTSRIKIEFEPDENLWHVLLDKSRLEDAILNICINSMHAMQDGGTLVLNTNNMHFSELDMHKVGMKSGDYVLLSISDTGTGMSKETQQKMFEPFFTTKGTEGTGLGMSQVYGFMQQSGGNIQVFSEPGHGTRITLYIPRQQETATIRLEESRQNTDKLPSGNETILVVEDEVALLDLAEEILTTHGYKVFRAESAGQALEILKSKQVDLMLSDVIMPSMDGYSLANEVGKIYPKIKIQMVTGFSDEHNINLVNDELHQQRIHKPFSSELLLGKIRSLLDEG